MLLHEKVKTQELTIKLSQETQRYGELMREKESLMELNDINTVFFLFIHHLTFIKKLLNGEIEKFQDIVQKMEFEISFYKEDNANLHKEKDKLRTSLENIMNKNTFLQEEIENEKQLSTQRTTERETKLLGQTAKLVDDLENIEAEKKNLKVMKFLVRV